LVRTSDGRVLLFTSDGQALTPIALSEPDARRLFSMVLGQYKPSLPSASEEASEEVIKEDKPAKIRSAAEFAKKANKSPSA